MSSGLAENGAVVPRAQTLPEARRHRRRCGRGDAALAQQFDPFDAGVVLGNAGVVVVRVGDELSDATFELETKGRPTRNEW